MFPFSFHGEKLAKWYKTRQEHINIAYCPNIFLKNLIEGPRIFSAPRDIYLNKYEQQREKKPVF